MKDKEIQALAVQLAYNCVRNTIIEDYHAAGKLTDHEIMLLNKEVTNKLYTALRYILGRKISQRSKRRLMLRWWKRTQPQEWDTPQIDESIEACVVFGLAP